MRVCMYLYLYVYYAFNRSTVQYLHFAHYFVVYFPFHLLTNMRVFISEYVCVYLYMCVCVLPPAVAC